MTKTAVLISGQTRSFTHCLATQQFHVFRHLSDPHFFVSVADDEQAGEAYLLEGLYPGKVFVERVKQPDLCLPGKTTPATNDVGASQRSKECYHAPYAVSASQQAILRQLWHLNRVWEFAQENGASNASVFVRIRPDLWFHNAQEHLSKPMELARPAANDVYVPWFSGAGGINDRFAIMGTRAVAHYFGTYGKLAELLKTGCPLHPESLIAESVRGFDVRKTLQSTFSLLRLDGNAQSPVEYFGERAAFVAAAR